jgi:hypothetical protein
MPYKREVVRAVQFSVWRKSSGRREPLDDLVEVRVDFRDLGRVTGFLTLTPTEARYQPNTRGGARHPYVAAHTSFVNTLEELGEVQQEARRKR